ncbi:MAG: cell division protein [Terrimonas sp.]|nr:cell division protein [Terrimonas sp.]
MRKIHLTTFIAAPYQRVFDLSRSIDLHKESMKKYREQAVSGIRFGLIEEDEMVTWQARHLGKTRMMRVKVTEMKKYERFVDEQNEGNFKMMRHEHYFKPCDNGTIMIDIFEYDMPYGNLGKLIDSLFLFRYITRLLELRNQTIKEFAEGEQWKRLLLK